MPELDPFDIRLESAVHFADAAHTRVDAAATAERAIRRGRAGRLSWLGYAVPVPVSILIVLALVLLALALSLGIGSPSNQHGLVALELMQDGRYRNVPIVDEQGRLAGIVRQHDLLRFLAESFPQELLNLPPRPRGAAREAEGA